MQVNVNFDLTLPLVALEVEEWHHDVSLTGFASFPFRSVVEVLFQVISDLLHHLPIKGNLYEWISTTIHFASKYKMNSYFYIKKWTFKDMREVYYRAKRDKKEAKCL